MHLGALGPEVRRLALQVVERHVELGLVRSCSNASSAVLAPTNPSAARERVRLLVDLLGDLVTGVLASVGDSLVDSTSADSTSASLSA